MLYKLFNEDGDYIDGKGHLWNLMECESALTPQGLNVGWDEFDTKNEAIKFFNIQSKDDMNALLESNFANEVTDNAKDLINIMNQITLLATKLDTIIYVPAIGINHLNDEGIAYPAGVTGNDVYSAITALRSVKTFVETTPNLYAQLFALIG